MTILPHYILENLTHLDLLPKVGAFLIALPMKIGMGAEAPIRAVALIPNRLEAT